LKFAVIPDVHIGRESVFINPWDKWYCFFKRIPTNEAVAGKAIIERLKRAVRWINTHPEIEFVISIGDITDSGTPEQLRKASQICNEIRVPFIPLIGNHDLWPYQRRGKEIIWEAKEPISVEKFECYFKNWRTSPLFKNVQKQKGVFQNFAFSIKDTRFVIVDNNNRRKAPFGLPGQAGWAKLHPESYFWLQKEVLSAQETKIIIFSHAPLNRRLLEKLQKLTGKYLINIAGHRHKRTCLDKKNVMTVIVNALYHEPLILLVEIFKQGIKIEYQKI